MCRMSDRSHESTVLDVDWSVFCEQHIGVLLAAAGRACARYGLPPSDAEDLVQEAILDCIPRPIFGSCEENVRQYVVTAIRNIAIDRARHSRHSRLVDVGITRIHELLISSMVDPGATREVRAVIAARTHLGTSVARSRRIAERQVSALFALRIEGESVAAHAARTGATAAQVKKWAERGAYLVAGWTHALCGGHPPDPEWSTIRSRYWRRGFGAGVRHRACSEAPHVS